MKVLTFEQIKSIVQSPINIAIFKAKQSWTAIDVLRLESISYNDRLWYVMREEFIDKKMIHEFALRCVENILFRLKTDIDYIPFINLKKQWINGLVEDCVLESVRKCVRTTEIKNL